MQYLFKRSWLAVFRAYLRSTVTAFCVLIPLCGAFAQTSDKHHSVERWVSTIASDVFRKNDSAWCGQGIHIEISSALPNFYKNKSDQYPHEAEEKEQLLADLRKAVGSDCPEARIARVSGFVRGKYVFEGCMKKEDGWQLHEMAYSESHEKLLNARYFEDSPECKLPDTASIFLAEYLFIKDHIRRMISPECVQYAQAKWGLPKPDAVKICDR